jgi:hypothetical protein
VPCRNYCKDLKIQHKWSRRRRLRWRRRLRRSREPRHRKKWRCPCIGLSTQRYLQRRGTVDCSLHASSQGPAADEGIFSIFNILYANDTRTNASWPHRHRHKPSHLPLDSSTSMSDAPAASRREGTKNGGESSSALSVSINFRHLKFLGLYPILRKVPNLHLLQNAKTWRSHNAGTYTDTFKCIFSEAQ